MTDPRVVTPPGYRERVQLPAGRFVNSTLPVASMQLGGVMVPTTGASGIEGCAFITTFWEEGDTHPPELVTVKVYVPGSRVEMLVVVPFPG